MRVGLSTAHLLAPEGSIEAALAQVAALAPDGLELAAGGPEPLQLAIVGALAKNRVSLAALEAYAPGPRPHAAPSLCAIDRDERAAARELAMRSLRMAADLGIDLVVAALGRIPCAAGSPSLAEPFARGEQLEVLLAEARAERQDRAPAHLDAARSALEPLFRFAEKAGIRLAIVNGPTLEDVPTASEVGELLRDFAGAPLGTFYDTAAAHAQETLGTAAPGEALAAFGAAALGAHLTDAAGLLRGLPPLTGEIDFAAIRTAIPGSAHLFVHCAPASHDREVAEALGAMRRLFLGDAAGHAAAPGP